MSENILKYTGPVPEGYELTGEVRVPKPGEHVLDDDMLNVIAREALVADHVSVIMRKKRWKPKDGDQVWRVTLYNGPTKWTFSSISMRKDYECGMLYRTEKEAHEASALLTSTLMDLFEKLNYAWQETLE